MHMKRAVSKLLRTIAAAPFMAQFRNLLERSSVYYSLNNLPSISLLLFTAYIGCGISSIFLDIIFIILSLAIVAVLLYHAQDRLLYYPGEPSNSRVFVPTPSQYGNMNYESVTISTSDGTNIHAFFVKHEKCHERPTIIMYHGNAGNIGHRIANAYHLVNESGTNVLLVDYRGYGLSGGTISEQGLYDDAISAIRYLRQREDVDPSRIVVHGTSLGGAVAINVATHPECADLLAVIIENSFTSLPDIAKRVLNFPIVKAVPDWCYKNKFMSVQKISGVRQPTLFLSGRSDTLIPPRHMDALYMASGAVKKEMSSFPKGTHNETWTEPGYFFAIQNFLQRL